jgi:hypothetical protein
MDIGAIAKEALNRQDKDVATDPTVRNILAMVKTFIETNRVMCYGGTAINNLLPEKDRFYDPDYDVPDYDFYSETPQIHAIKLVDKFTAAGFTNVEAKPAVHLGSFKVFVNYMGVADITQLDHQIFDKLWKTSIVLDSIHYVPPNFLRMSMYLELSRPRGDVSRWEKVYHRLQLLNANYPIACKQTPEKERDSLSDETRSTIEALLQNKPAILLGMHAMELHSKSKSNVWQLPIDILVEPSNVASYVEKLCTIFKTTTTQTRPAYDELIPAHTDITDKGVLLARVFETEACHSYHQLKSGLKIGSIPTLLQFYYSFIYADSHYMEGEYDENRLMCIAQRLVDLANSKKKRRYEVLTPIDCVGHQQTLLDMRAKSAEMREKLASKKDEFLQFFFTYTPSRLTKTQKRALKSKFKTQRNH